MILWGSDHRDRAEALATAYGEQSAAVSNLARSSEGIVPLLSTDATLTVWGHGDATHFAEMLDVEFGVLIKAWKKKNSKLKTVELITCDAQHNVYPLAGFARRVMQYVRASYSDITFKALPVGQHSDDRSILWGNAGTSSFCYITAPSETTFDNANLRLQQLDLLCNHDLGQVATAMAKERTLSSPRNYTVNGGGLNVLRVSLATVKTE